MSWNRREVLGSLGVASAQALLWACGGQAKQVRREPEVSGEIRSWLHDAVGALRGRYPVAHGLAVSRRRTTGAIDVLGAGVARGRCDGVVLTVRDHDGAQREQVTSDLSRDGVGKAVQALVGRAARPASIDFGKPQIFSPELPANQDPRLLIDGQLLHEVGQLAARDKELSSRIVYAASLIEIDDATVWSVAEGHDLEQRLVRVRRALTRVAWNGTRPIVSEVSRGYLGGIDAQDLRDDQIAAVTAGALVMMTPSAFDDGEQAVQLDPEVTAMIVDAAARSLLTNVAMRRPEVAHRLAAAGGIASPALTLVDDPAIAGAYGGFHFDDEGAPAGKITLLEGGRVTGKLADREGRGLRPGHVGALEGAPSNLRLAPGSAPADGLLDDGYVLQGAIRASVDPASDRIVVAVARATERRGGKTTGRVFADIELAGGLGQLLSSVTAVASTTETIAIRDEVDGLPRFRSIEAPALRLKGLLRARRSPS